MHFSDPHAMIAHVNAFLARSSKKTGNGGFLYSLENRIYGRHHEDIIELAADFIHRNLSDAHAVIVSGDVSARGIKDDLLNAYGFVLQKSSVGKGYRNSNGQPTIRTNDRSIIVIPGNHDRFDDWKGLAGGTEFDTYFQSSWKAGLNGIQATLVKNKDGMQINFVCGDFCLPNDLQSEPPGPFASLGQGRCYVQTVQKMKDATEYLRGVDVGCGIVWVIHFPPFWENMGFDNKLKLVDHNLIVNAAIECRVSYILTGHLHTQHILEFGKVKIISAGTAGILNPKIGSWLHEIDFDVVNGEVLLVNRSNYKYDPEAAGFKFYNDLHC